MAVVELVKEGHLATITINRPEALNALNREVLIGIQETADDLAKDARVHVVILKGAGEKAFVAGADIKEMQSLSQVAAAEFSALGSQAFGSLAQIPQVVIGQIQGFALGGGLELALSADFLMASERAKFGLPEATLGLIPGFGGTHRLAARIGVARALEWMVSAEKYSAEQAFACGLVNRVTDANDLEGQVLHWAEKILSNGPQAVRAAKRLVAFGQRSDFGLSYHAESCQFGLRFQTPESKEGIAAFIEKRRAVFPQ